MKVVINTCYGGFGLSEPAEEALKAQGLKMNGLQCYDRANPLLVKLVEEWGERCFGRCAKLKVVEVPDDVEWEVEDYDGVEWVAEKHRVWS